DWIIRPQLLRVPGVVEVNPIGGNRREILVAPDPSRLLAAGLTTGDLVAAIEAGTGNRGAGFIERNGAQWLVRVPGQPEGLDALRDLVVRTERGAPLRVRDVATVGMGNELRTGAATMDGRE